METDVVWFSKFDLWKNLNYEALIGLVEKEKMDLSIALG